MIFKEHKMIIIKFFRIIFLFGGISLFVMYFISTIMDGPKPPNGTLYTSVMYCVFGFLFYVLETNSKNKKINRKKTFLNKIESIIKKYMYELASEKINNIEEDAYGNVFFNQWYTNEIPYFIETVIKKEIKIPFKYLNDVIELVDEMSNIGIDKYYRKNEKKKVYRNIKKCEPVLDSNDYEKICTGILNKSGWEILLAKYDEGVGADIIAEKGKATVLIKCKKEFF